MADRVTEEDIVEIEEDEREADLETDDETEVEEDEGASEEASNDEDKEGGEEDSGEESDHIVVTIGEEEEGKPDEDKQPAPQWVKDLRKQRRIDAKRIKELEKQVEGKTAPPEILGDKPTLESSEYDAKVYETKITDWFAKKRKIELRNEEANNAKEQQKKEHSAKYDKYNTDKAALDVPDFDEAEEVVIETLSETQQGALLQGSADPALLVYALGKNEAKARELAKIKDPVKFIFAAAKLEAQLKVSKGKRKPAPEGKVKGSGRSNSAIDSTLNRLRAEAEKTGDYTKVIAYKKKTRSA